ncbi:hypothetical protein BDN72DRAFT_749144, partial [Pluteus cervinus]
MDDYINAKTRMLCRRRVVNTYFGNDSTPKMDHLKCDTVTQTGCQRCQPTDPDTYPCCDRCKLDLAARFDVVREKIPRGPQKSNLKPFTMTPADEALQKRLTSWRHKYGIKCFSRSLIREHGDILFMSDIVLSRIVDAAHYQKLPTVEHLLKELPWNKDYIQEFGSKLLQIIHKDAPVAVASTPASGPGPLTGSELAPTPAVVKVFKPRSCGKCGH